MSRPAYKESMGARTAMVAVFVLAIFVHLCLLPVMQAFGYAVQPITPEKLAMLIAPIMTYFFFKHREKTAAIASGATP